MPSHTSHLRRKQARYGYSPARPKQLIGRGWPEHGAPSLAPVKVACCLVTSLADEPRRGPLDFDIASRPAPPLSCWSVPGWVQQMNAAPTSSRIILGLAVENSSTVDWRIVAKSWGAAFDLLAASGLRLTGEDRSICVEQGARTG